MLLNLLPLQAVISFLFLSPHRSNIRFDSMFCIYCSGSYDQGVNLGSVTPINLSISSLYAIEHFVAVILRVDSVTVTWLANHYFNMDATAKPLA